MNPARILRSAIDLKPSTLLHLHSMLAQRKYRMLFSSERRHPPGPKGPNQELIDAVVELKRRNPQWGCPRIAQQIALAFGVEINKDVVRRILGIHFWVLVVMDQFTRRIVGFGVPGDIVDGPALCRMFNRAIRGQTTPKYLSTNHDPLYRFHQWQATTSEC